MKSAGLAILWTGRVWIGLVAALFLASELLAPVDSFVLATAPIRFFFALLLCVPGIALVLWGRHLAGPAVSPK